MPFVVAKSMNSLHGRILDKIGADKIIYPEQSMGLRVARNLMSGGYLDVFELSAEFSMAEFSMPVSWSGSFRTASGQLFHNRHRKKQGSECKS